MVPRMVILETASLIRIIHRPLVNGPFPCNTWCLSPDYVPMVPGEPAQPPAAWQDGVLVYKPRRWCSIVTGQAASPPPNITSSSWRVFKLASRSGALLENGSRMQRPQRAAAAVESLDQIQTPNEWHLLQLGSNGTPAPRAGHGAAIAGRRMFIVGGASADGFLDDVQVLHAEKRLWLRFNCYPRRSPAVPDSDTTPGFYPSTGAQLFQPLDQGPKCIGHHVALWEKRLFVLGGQTEPLSMALSVYVLDLESHSWSLLSPKGTNVPTGRSGQSIVQVGSMLVLFGGEDVRGRILNDIYIFDLKTLVWLPLKTTGAKPAPRQNHSAACYSNRFLWVFGGKSKDDYFNDLHYLDFQTMEWSREKLKGPRPKPRAGQASVISGSKWYMVGGELRGNEVKETVAFDVEKREWSMVNNVRSGSPLANSGLSVVKMRSKGMTFFLAFGGHGAVLSNQVYAMLVGSPRQGEECKSEGSMNSASLSMSFNFSSTSLIELGQDEAPRVSPKTAILQWDTDEAADNPAGSNSYYDAERGDASSVGHSEDFGSANEHSRELRRSHSGRSQMQDTSWTPRSARSRSTRNHTRSDHFLSYAGTDFDQDESSFKEENLMHNTETADHLAGNLSPRSNSANSILSKAPNAEAAVARDGRMSLRKDHRPSDAMTTSLSSRQTLRGNYRLPENSRGPLMSDTEPGSESDADSPPRPFGERDSDITVTSKSLDLQEQLRVALQVNEELEGRLAEAHRTNSETLNALQAALAENQELGKQLAAASETMDELEEEVFTLLKTKSEAEKKLRASLKALEETDKKMQVTSQLQEDAEMKLRSTLRLKEDAEKKLAIQAKRLEEAEALCAEKDFDKNRVAELEKWLEEKEKHLAYAMTNQAVAEGKLVTAMKEKRELKEKVLGTMHQQEEARSQSKVTNAENGRLGKDLVHLRTTLKEVQRELQAKELQLTESHSKRFELQVELFDVKQKLRTALDTATPVSHNIASNSVIVQ